MENHANKETHEIALDGVIVYAKSNNGKTKNYVKKFSHHGNEYSIEFTTDFNEAVVYEKSQKMDIVMFLALPFIQRLRQDGKSASEITDCVIANFGADDVSVTVKD
jgi:hypothetical protein